jgi:hypothetical protein
LIENAMGKKALRDGTGEASDYDQPQEEETNSAPTRPDVRPGPGCSRGVPGLMDTFHSSRHPPTVQMKLWMSMR